MVLQSLKQYRSFADSDHVKQYGAHYGKDKMFSRTSRRQVNTSDVDSFVTAESEYDSNMKVKVKRRSYVHGNNDDIIKAKRSKTSIDSTRKRKMYETDKDPFLVRWEIDEQDDPMNWSWTKKWSLIAMVASIATLVGAGSAIDAAAIDKGAVHFGVSTEIMSLQVAVFLIGSGIAAPLLGSLSEIGGRNPVYAITLLSFVGFQVGAALATKIETRVILRFLAGLAGSTPLSNAGGTLADVANARQRTFVFPVFACAAFMGPTIGPVIGGYIINAGQAWCEWIVAIFAAVLLVIVLLFMPETYGPVLLKWKAAHIRKVTGDNRYQSALERERNVTSFAVHFKHTLALPFLYLLYEPIVLFFTLYMTVVYIIIFGDLTAYPLIFGPFGFTVAQQGLAFIPIAFGLILTLGAIPFSYSRYVRVTEKIKETKRLNGDKNWQEAEPPPEERLVLAMYGTFLVPIGLFFQAWAASPSLSPWPCLSAGIIVGAGILMCFISSYAYCIDVYKAGSATALASLTFIRYIVAGGAVMFTAPMYHRLGNQVSLTILASISLATCSIPWIFYIYGKRIRQWSRFVPPSD